MAHISPSDLNVSDGFERILVYVNTVTNSVVSNGILIAIWIIIVAGYYKFQRDIWGGVAIAGTVTWVMAILFRIAQFVSTPTVIMATGIWIIGLIPIFLPKKE